MKNLFKRNRKPVDNWYADYRMEDGSTGRITETIEIYRVENIAHERGHSAIYWSVNGGEWFNSWELLKD